MITVRNEFETIPVFEHIAGSNCDTWTDRETTVEILYCWDCSQQEYIEQWSIV